MFAKFELQAILRNKLKAVFRVSRYFEKWKFFVYYEKKIVSTF